MSINFNDEMSNEARDFINEMFEVEAIDGKTALIQGAEKDFNKALKELANKANQPVTLELSEIGDRKEVGGVVYELDEKGWKQMPIGTTL